MSATRHPPGWVTQTWIMFKKDVTIELRSGEVLVTSGFFALLVVVIASMAFYVGPDTRGQVAAGVVWLATAFAAILALGRSWQHEREEGALLGLLLSPVRPSAIFAGKALGLLAFLWAIEAAVIPAAAVLFALDLGRDGFGLLAFALVATPGVAASATLFGAMGARTRARDLVLAIVLFPLLAPTLLAAVVGTRELLSGVPLAELGDYFRLMAVFDVTFVAGGVGLFGILVDG